MPLEHICAGRMHLVVRTGIMPSQRRCCFFLLCSDDRRAVGPPPTALLFGVTTNLHQNQFLNVWFRSHLCNKPMDSVSGHWFLHEGNRKVRPRRGDMRAAAEYRRHAEECRRLARHMAAPKDRRALEELAETWDMLAKMSDRDLVPEDRTSPILNLIKERKSA
jgi:hypothetical protein